VFRKLCRQGLDHRSTEFRTYSPMSDGVQGAFLVPTGFQYELEQALKAYGGMRPVSRLLTTASGNALPWPTSNDTGVSGEQIGENTTVTQANPTIANITLNAWKYSTKMVQVSVELLQRSVAVEVDCTFVAPVGGPVAAAASGAVAARLRINAGAGERGPGGARRRMNRPVPDQWDPPLAELPDECPTIKRSVDATLDHMTRATSQSSYTWYSEKGDSIFAYSGDFALGLKPCVKPANPIAPMPRVLFLHRTSAMASDLKLIAPRASSGWF